MKNNNMKGWIRNEMENRIEKGDKVEVVFASDGSSLRGVVDHTPQATGDSWIIMNDDGLVNYVQIFEIMQLMTKGEEQ